MEEPPDIRRPSRRMNITELMRTVRTVRARKVIASGSEFLSNSQWQNALDDFNEAAMIFEELEDPLQRSNMLSLAGICLYALAKWDEAKAAMKEAVELKRTVKDDEGLATDLKGLGEVLFRKGDLEEADKAFAESLELFTRLDLKDGAASAKKGIEKVKCALTASCAQ